MGSLNLAAFVKNKQFQYQEFINAIEVAVIGLNDVLEEGINLHPLEEQRKSASDWRQIGLGILGLADMLIEMEIKYDSEEAFKVCDKIGEVLSATALKTSALISKEKGPYPMYNQDHVFNSRWYQMNNRLGSDKYVYEYGLRNSQILTIAPTGSISTMLGVSGGIEPIFSNSYTRKTESLHGQDVYYKIFTPIVDRYMKEHNIEKEENLPEWFVTSSTIKPLMRIYMQSIWQKHIDASISSTVNLPETATIEDVETLYKFAWESNLKGLTIYRAGCKRDAVLTSGDRDNIKELERGDWKEIAPDTQYFKRKIKIGCGKLSLFIGWSNKEKKIQELWVQRTGEGGCEKSIQSTVIAMSGMLRLGGNIFNIKKAFTGLGACNSFVAQRSKGKQLSQGSSCATAILNEIEKFLKEQNQEIKIDDKKKNNIQKKEDIKEDTPKCPECGQELSFSGGCVVCPSCGFSKCD